MRLTILIPLALLASGFGTCWTSPSDAFVGAEPVATVSAQVFSDQNGNGFRDGTEPVTPNAQMEATLRRHGSTTTAIETKSLTSDSSGLVNYSYSPQTLDTALYSITVRDPATGQTSAPIYRQIDVDLPFRSEGTTGKESYCVAYDVAGSIRAVEAKFRAGADLSSLSAWRSIAYQISAPELILAATIASLQRRVGANARVSFTAGSNPPYVLGQAIPPKPIKQTCFGPEDCAPGERCYRTPDDEGRYCVPTSPCASTPTLKAVVLATNDFAPPILDGRGCPTKFIEGRKGSAGHDLRNGGDPNSRKAFTYVNGVVTLERPGFPRSAADTVEDIGRQIAHVGAHEVGHTLGLTAPQNLAGSLGAGGRTASNGDVYFNNGANHPDALNDLVSRYRVRARGIMNSNAAPWLDVPDSLIGAELQKIIPTGIGDPCGKPYSTIREPSVFSHVEAEYLQQATPNLFQ